MPNIVMTYSGLAEAVTQMNTAKESIDQVIQNIDKSIETLKASWTGASYEAFKAAWEEAKPKMKSISDKIGQYGPELKQVVERQKATDDENAKRIQQNMGY